MKKNADFTNVRQKIDALSPEKQEIALRLLEKAQFMDAELTKLQETISVKGWVEEYQNGATQRGFKKSTEGDAYNVLVKNFNSVMTSLCKMLPDDAGSSDELSDFLGR